MVMLGQCGLTDIVPAEESRVHDSKVRAVSVALL